MSIEKALADLTSAVAENTAVQEKVLAALTSGAKPTAGSGTKAADKPASKPAGKPASKPKNPTEDDLKKLFGPYLTGATDKAEKSRLNDTIRPILDEFGAPKITEIPEENRAKAMEYGKMLVDAYNDGGIDAAEEVRFDFMGDDDGGEDEGDDVL